jgi:hypothetical protein
VSILFQPRRNLLVNNVSLENSERRAVVPKDEGGLVNFTCPSAVAPLVLWRDTQNL